MGKRRAVPSHDRPPLDPGFGSGPRIVVPQFLPWRFVRPYTVQKSASASALSKRDPVNRTFGSVYEDGCEPARMRRFSFLERTISRSAICLRWFAAITAALPRSTSAAEPVDRLDSLEISD